jgi:hypothetical protein
VGAGAGTSVLEPSERDRIEERVRALRRRVYGRDPRPEDVAALAAALAEIRPVRAEPAVARTEPEAPGPVTPPAPSGPGVVARVVAVVRAVPPRVLLTGLAVTVLGALAGVAGLLLVGRPSAADADPAAPHYVPTIAVAADTALLGRPARPDDRPTALIGPDLVGSSFRRLVAYPAAGVSLWAARDRFGEACLAVVDTYYRTACADPQTVRESGLVLTWSSGPGYPASTTEDYTAVWRDGLLGAGRTAR